MTLTQNKPVDTFVNAKSFKLMWAANALPCVGLISHKLKRVGINSITDRVIDDTSMGDGVRNNDRLFGVGFF